jgi:hypothetical protein
MYVIVKSLFTNTESFSSTCFTDLSDKINMSLKLYIKILLLGAGQKTKKWVKKNQKNTKIRATLEKRFNKYLNSKGQTHDKD